MVINQQFILDNSIPEPNSGCFLWLGPMATVGYGNINMCGKQYLAHRESFRVFKCDPGELHVLHKCDTRLCVNPNHLFLGTQADNMHDMARKGRNAKKLTHEKVAAIREDKRSQRQIARDYGVSQPLIGMIKRREWWRHT